MPSAKCMKINIIFSTVETAQNCKGVGGDVEVETDVKGCRVRMSRRS